jgi:hypothetical protein
MRSVVGYPSITCPVTGNTGTEAGSQDTVNSDRLTVHLHMNFPDRQVSRERSFAMKLQRIAILAAAALLVFTSLSAGAADYVRIPGTRTSLQPPEGFSLADRFPGFQRADVQSSIMVSEIPAPATEMMKGMTREGLAKQGMTLVSSQAERIGGREALLLQVAQSAAGTAFLKWMLVTGDQQTTLMIVGTFPKAVEERIGSAIRGSVLSVSWPSGASIDQFEGLPFRVTPSPKLKVAGRMANMLLLTESGRMGPLGPTEALYVVGSSVSEGRIADLRAFSEARAKQTAEVKDIRNFDGHTLKVGELAAYELLADAKDMKTGTPIRLYQVVALDGSGYIMMQGLVGAARAAALLPEFRRVTASFRKAPAEAARPPAPR